MIIRYCTGALALFAATLLAGAAIAAEGEVKIVLPEQPANLDPCRSIRSDIGRIINSNITETLTVIDTEKGTVGPWLAEKWEQVDDLTWRVHLKSGVKFQDGVEFNAEAVVKSINRLMNPNITCDSRSKFGDVKLTPKAVDAQTVEISSDSPVPIMPTLLGTVQIVSPNMPFDKERTIPSARAPMWSKASPMNRSC